MEKNLKYLPTTGSFLLAVIFAFSVFFHACKKDPYQTDRAGIDMDLKISRFEEELFTLDFDSIQAAIPVLKARYGDFFDIFNYRIINIGGPDMVTYPDYLKSFLTDYLNNEVYRVTMEVFPDLEELQANWGDASEQSRSMYDINQGVSGGATTRDNPTDFNFHQRELSNYERRMVWDILARSLTQQELNLLDRYRPSTKAAPMTLFERLRSLTYYRSIKRPIGGLEPKS